MTDVQDNPMPSDGPPRGALTPGRVFFPLWTWRRNIGLVMAGVLAAYVIGSVGYYLTRPVTRTARVTFRLLFGGTGSGTYPNGTPFAITDLLAQPVLTEVYTRNNLEGHLTFGTFQNGLFVLEENVEKEILDSAYKARLADPRLMQVDRARLETEFRQRREAMPLADLSLHFVLTGPEGAPSSTVMEKVLNDVLAVWAEQSAVTKGALKYQVELLTPAVILKDTMATPTLLIRYDLLRRHVGRLLSQVSRLSSLPGANTIRIGESKFSLLDIRTNFEDLLEFQLNPLIRRRLIYALPPEEVALNALYLEDRVQELERTRLTAIERKQQLEAALQTFMRDTVAPPKVGEGNVSGTEGVSAQLGDSFFDRIIDLAGRSGATDYRMGLTDRIIAVGDDALTVDQDIAFYREALRLLRLGRGSAGPIALKPEDVVKHFDDLQTRVVETLMLTNLAYDTISAQNLNPRSVFYRVSGPFTLRTERQVTLVFLALLGGLLLAAVALLVVIVAMTAGAVQASRAARQ